MSISKYDLSSQDIDLISTFPICSDMTLEESTIFSKHLTGLEYTDGEVLFTQQSRMDDHLFIILEGEIKITIKLEEIGQNSATIVNQQQGNIAGILSFIDGRPHMASAQAITPARIAIITRKDYQHFKEHHPDIAANMLQYLIVAADDLACQLLKKLSESLAYIHGSTRPRTMA